MGASFGMSGKNHSDETRRKMSDSQKYNKNRAGRTNSELHRQRQSAAAKRRYENPLERKKTGAALRGNTNGKGPRTEEFSQKCREIRLEAWKNPEYAEKISLANTIAMEERIRRGIKYLWNTRPELELEKQLCEQGLQYEKQKRIANMLVDFYLPQQNLVIEVDGCYWHGCECQPKSAHTDNFIPRRQRLHDLGYDSIRIWEHELVT